MKQKIMKQKVMIGLFLMVGLICGLSISPLLAQSHAADQSQMTCFVGESSNAACGGKWIFFAGNTGGLDDTAWVVRVNSETGEIWYKNGKKLQLVKEAK
ncbi:MAG: hypothetical protein ACR2RD_04870 [Woeseiaceae bacterium]